MPPLFSLLGWFTDSLYFSLIPFMATIGLGMFNAYSSGVVWAILTMARAGFGAYNYYVAAKLRREQALLEEEQRLARNQQLMDAYGDKNSLHELQHALDTYSR